MRDSLQELLDAAAKEREQLHAGHASSRPLSENYELLGLRGEVEFSRVTGLPVDLERRPRGDRGIDFTAPLRYSIDVKTARKPGNLICEQGKVIADIYVLASYSDETGKCELLGWEMGSILKHAPVRDFGHGIINHYIPTDRLRPMHQLIDRIMRLR